jgi:hypothetical protein
LVPDENLSSSETVLLTFRTGRKAYPVGLYVSVGRYRLSTFEIGNN